MEKPSEDHNRCVKKLEGALSRNDKARRLLDSIEALGCSLPKEFFVCRPCEGATISGGFTVPNSENHGVTYQPQIIMCEDNKVAMETETFEHTLVHELVHAYDQCRAKIEWKDCIQHACTEIRASTLSGECNFLHELYRGHTTIRGGQAQCVARRAEKSVAMNPNCKGVAADAVKAAFDECRGDKAPFTRIEDN